MTKNNLLSLGLPTYKRPDAAIRLINLALDINIYDEIVVSSNSMESELDQFFDNLSSNIPITYNVQKENVGLSSNYLSLIQLSNCEYIHIVSDEDYLIKKNISKAKEYLHNSNASLVALSVLDENNIIYKDSLNADKKIPNFCSDYGHIGCSIIKRSIWKEDHYEQMRKYSLRRGSVYPTSAAAIISYSADRSIECIEDPLIKMGKKHQNSEIRGKNIYGFESRASQLLSIMDLLKPLKLKNKNIIIFKAIYFFSSHAFLDSYIKFNENFVSLFLSKRLLNSEFSVTSKVFLGISILFSYIIRAWRFLKAIIKKIIFK